jgi:hypothetical protein
LIRTNIREKKSCHHFRPNSFVYHFHLHIDLTSPLERRNSFLTHFPTNCFETFSALWIWKHFSRLLSRHESLAI